VAIQLNTTRLSLRDFTRDDVDAVHRYASDPEVTRFLFWGPNTREQTRAFIANCLAEQNKRPRETFQLAVTLSECGTVVGSIGLVARRLEYREYELGYCLGRDAWGQGYAREAARALLDFALTELSAHRIYALIDPSNPASIRLIEELGFRREGLQLRDTLIEETWRDTLVYAMLADEWSSA
jgi:ribosomal-protein-alanine N-acetyltransferase